MYVMSAPSVLYTIQSMNRQLKLITCITDMYRYIIAMNLQVQSPPPLPSLSGTVLKG
jgi:hypothetical protein